MSESKSQGQDLFSDEDIEQIKVRYERQLRLAAAMSELTATEPPPQAPRGGQVPDFPPEPNFLQTWVKIPARFAVESIRHLPDSAGIVGGITKLLSTAEGRALLARLEKALVEHNDDPQLFKDILSFIGSVQGQYGSLILGAITEAQGIQGMALMTGIAIPTKGTGKAKWFSGAKRSKGLILEATASLLFGYRVEEPENLTGQFYGYHAGIDIEISIGTNFYFDTSKELEYQGFLTSVGVGVGLGTAVFWG